MIKNISKYLLTNILGWTIKSEFPDIKKSVIIFAPHTSYWDGFYGKLFLMQLDINYKFLSKKEFFKFPLKYFFRMYRAIPVSKNKKFITEIVEFFNQNETLHIVLSPEGQLSKTDHWKKGFYYMAKNANVPIVVGYIDYQKKEIGLKGIISEVKDLKEIMPVINNMYKDVSAKYPESFIFDKRFI